jgi:hypothetical protein
MRKFQKIRHPSICRGPKDVDSNDPTALDPGLRQGDGTFFNTLLDPGDVGGVVTHRNRAARINAKLPQLLLYKKLLGAEE